MFPAAAIIPSIINNMQHAYYVAAYYVTYKLVGNVICVLHYVTTVTSHIIGHMTI